MGKDDFTKFAEKIYARPEVAALSRKQDTRDLERTNER